MYLVVFGLLLKEIYINRSSLSSRNKELKGIFQERQYNLLQEERKKLFFHVYYTAMPNFNCKVKI